MGEGGKGISGTTWPIEMVHLSKFAEFHQEMSGNIFTIASSLQISKRIRIITCKCYPDKGHFISILSGPRFSAPLAFVCLEPWKWSPYVQVYKGPMILAYTWFPGNNTNLKVTHFAKNLMHNIKETFQNSWKSHMCCSIGYSY